MSDRVSKGNAVAQTGEFVHLFVGLARLERRAVSEGFEDGGGDDSVVGGCGAGHVWTVEPCCHWKVTRKTAMAAMSASDDAGGGEGVGRSSRLHCLVLLGLMFAIVGPLGGRALNSRLTVL